MSPTHPRFPSLKDLGIAGEDSSWACEVDKCLTRAAATKFEFFVVRQWTKEVETQQALTQRKEKFEKWMSEFAARKHPASDWIHELVIQMFNEAIKQG